MRTAALAICLCLASCGAPQSGTPFDKCEATAGRITMAANWAGAVCRLLGGDSAKCERADRYASASATAAESVCGFLPRPI